MIEHELYFEGNGFLFLGRINFPYRLNAGDTIVHDCLHPHYCEIDDTETEGIIKEDGEITNQWADFLFNTRANKFIVNEIKILPDGGIVAKLKLYDN